MPDFKAKDHAYIKKVAHLTYQSKLYQVRIYGMFLFGYLSGDVEILNFRRDEISKDENWKVQEVLAKSFDEWLKNNNPNTRRALTEGLRIWTGRLYFKECRLSIYSNFCSRFIFVYQTLEIELHR